MCETGDNGLQTRRREGRGTLDKQSKSQTHGLTYPSEFSAQHDEQIYKHTTNVYVMSVHVMHNVCSVICINMVSGFFINRWLG